MVMFDIDLVIDEQEFVAITGPSGCGKSTLLGLLGGIDKPTSGHVFWRGVPMDRIRNLDMLRAREIGFVFQSFHLLPTLSAVENVQIPMFEGISRASVRKSRAISLLERVGLGHRINHAASKLSIGERQRVAIARALANQPRLILADEPTGNLDSANTEHVLGLFREIHDMDHMTLVMVTHSPEVAAAASRHLSMRDGRIVKDEHVAPSPRMQTPSLLRQS
jgi:putative ABC transport system ATP-binding protein